MGNYQYHQNTGIFLRMMGHKKNVHKTLYLFIWLDKHRDTDMCVESALSCLQEWILTLPSGICRLASNLLYPTADMISESSAHSFLVTHNTLLHG